VLLTLSRLECEDIRVFVQKFEPFTPGLPFGSFFGLRRHRFVVLAGVLVEFGSKRQPTSKKPI
jgi:hypothetical protein